MDKTRLLIVFVLIGLLGVFVFRVINLQFALLLVITVGGWFIYQYNLLQGLSQQIQESHSNILISMKKRLDLANKLLEIAANYADHEKMVQLGVSKVEALPAVSEPSQILNEGLVGRLMVMSRDYPELQANQTYQVLMQQLEDIERNLQNKREIYNQKVRTYNTKRTTIPMVFLSEQIGFHAAPYFDALSADALEGMKPFMTADGTQLKHFLSGLGEQMIETSASLTNGFEKAASGLLESPNGTKPNPSEKSQMKDS